MIETVFGPGREERERIERELMSDTVRIKVTLDLDGRVREFEEDVPRVAKEAATSDIYGLVHDWFKEDGVWEVVRPELDKAVEAVLQGQPKEGWRSAVAVYRMYPDGLGSHMETWYMPDLPPEELEERTREWLDACPFRVCRIGYDWERRGEGI